MCTVQPIYHSVPYVPIDPREILEKTQERSWRIVFHNLLFVYDSSGIREDQEELTIVYQFQALLVH